MATSILARKLDLVYLIFFLIHIPVLFCVDLVPLYPSHLIPTPLLHLRQYYITTYSDRFFTSPPSWFNFYIYLEAIYHVPLSFWAVATLWKGGLVEVQLLIYAVQTAVTTATCIADFLGWEAVSWEVKRGLMGLYGPYLAVSIFMGVDMYARLNRALAKNAAGGAKKVN